MTELSPDQARRYWKALMDNASALIADAHTLLAAESYGRARSLTVLAQEELGKALWIYDAFQLAWSRGDQRSVKVDDLAKHGRNHTRKYLQAFVFGDELASFWGDYGPSVDAELPGETWEQASKRRRRDAEVAATAANLAKQRGFYVDRDDSGAVLSPTRVEAGTTASDLETAAQVVEMLLIRDHSRMKLDAVTPYDSTHQQQLRLLPIAHPDDWAAAPDELKHTMTEGGSP